MTYSLLLLRVLSPPAPVVAVVGVLGSCVLGSCVLGPGIAADIRPSGAARCFQLGILRGTVVSDCSPLNV
ncbi:hypothetical protein QR77_14100 [Streptomyces sp. 150FB]|nr:hypothetical protein QR77_14100 [Streptomyces sp. 150FB]